MPFSEIWDFEKCDGCEKCVNACKQQCISKIKTKHGWCKGFNIDFEMEQCNGCEDCIKACTMNALSIVDASYQLSVAERLGMYEGV